MNKDMAQAKFKSEQCNFSSPGLHLAMIKDRVRTEAYRRAIENVVREDDVILDLGCGTGILSFFAAKKGCRKIYAIDSSDIIDAAAETAKKNNLTKHIKFIKENIYNFKTEEKIDVLIHEQIGNFLWDEDLISKISYIRDNFLKENGTLIPFKIDLYLAPVNYKSPAEKAVSFWGSKKYGIDFSNLKYKSFLERSGFALHPSNIKLVNEKSFLASAKLAYTIDLRTEVGLPSLITADYRLERFSVLRGMCAFLNWLISKWTFKLLGS